ncbi:hypothetical protein F511_20302 [Dorcoceras hygrometricum]|uniref:Uncharacterized protein n=1 Tax=Dorcoceras hygrometricum TaxID=472368 RepID=A0A2Z7CZT5_9LAMI|nr:hypothetical protein F511_20302 [Dorcoceras hygrometricum]
MCGGPLTPPRACARASSRVARKNQRAGRAWLRDVGSRCARWSTTGRATWLEACRHGRSLLADAKLLAAAHDRRCCLARWSGAARRGTSHAAGLLLCDGRLMCTAAGRATCAAPCARPCVVLGATSRAAAVRFFLLRRRRPAASPASLRRCRDG